MKNVDQTKGETPPPRQKKKTHSKSCQKHLQEGVMSALDSACTETGD